MAALRQAVGDLDGAVDLLDEAEPLFRPGFVPDLRTIAATRARVDIARGRLDAARSWAIAHDVTPADRSTYAIEHAQLTLARLLIAEGDPSAAIRISDAVLVDAQDAERDGSIVEARMVRALAHHARDEPDAAGADIAAALVAGVPAGFVRLFLDEGEPMVALLRGTAAAGPDGAPTLADRLLARARPDAPTTTAASVDPDRLSPREIEVLRLLATDLSGPEIASALYVSVNTLRTHTKRIYAKLGVSTRRAAVGRATTLGLL
jgi:LuxR family maltose regulon positive regulatory protein